MRVLGLEEKELYYNAITFLINLKFNLFLTHNTKISLNIVMKKRNFKHNISVWQNNVKYFIKLDLKE